MTSVERRGRPDLARDLERAIGGPDLGFEYQPVIDLRTRAVVAVEALLRWRHPLMGTIAPRDFLPTAVASGLIVPIGEGALEASATQLRTWRLGIPSARALSLAINVAPVQVAAPGLAERVARVLGGASLEPTALTFDLGPGCGAHSGVLRDLRDLGVGLALEDLGGEGTRDELERLPLTEAKLHPGCLRSDWAGDPLEDLLVAAHGRRLVVTAKAVETRDQARRLTVLGCDRAQGFVFSKPLGAAGIGTLLLHGGTLDLARS